MRKKMKNFFFALTKKKCYHSPPSLSLSTPPISQFFSIIFSHVLFVCLVAIFNENPKFRFKRQQQQPQQNSIQNKYRKFQSEKFFFFVANIEFNSILFRIDIWNIHSPRETDRGRESLFSIVFCVRACV